MSRGSICAANNSNSELAKLSFFFFFPLVPPRKIVGPSSNNGGLYRPPLTLVHFFSFPLFFGDAFQPGLKRRREERPSVSPETTGQRDGRYSVAEATGSRKDTRVSLAKGFILPPAVPPHPSVLTSLRVSFFLSTAFVERGSLTTLAVQAREW